MIGEIPSRQSKADLESLFASGSEPAGIPEGRFRGEFLSFHLLPGVSQAASAAASLWMPWKGKVFLQREGLGYNWISAGGRAAAALAWPFYRHYIPAEPGNLLAFPFRLSHGPAYRLPRKNVLRLDYDLPVNPRWNVRRIRDELVALEPGCYLGRAYLTWIAGYRKLWAYFKLERENDIAEL